MNLASRRKLALNPCVCVYVCDLMKRHMAGRVPSSLWRTLESRLDARDAFAINARCAAISERVMNMDAEIEGARERERVFDEEMRRRRQIQLHPPSLLRFMR